MHGGCVAWDGVPAAAVGGLQVAHASFRAVAALEHSFVAFAFDRAYLFVLLAAPPAFWLRLGRGLLLRGGVPKCRYRAELLTRVVLGAGHLQFHEPTQARGLAA